MNHQERHTVTGLVILMFLLWGGFVFHRAPLFPGSLIGSIIGVIGTFFMFIPLWYLVIKRVKKWKVKVTKVVKLSTLLRWHIYAGIIGPLLGLIHTGHRFDSIVGISLTILMMLVVISGFIGRYLLAQISTEVREKKKISKNLKEEYELILKEKTSDSFPPQINYMPFFFKRVVFALNGASLNEQMILKLVDSISDIEYSIKMHETIKQWFKKWLKLHIVISIILYIILIFHIFSEFYFGLRWL